MAVSLTNTRVENPNQTYMISKYNHTSFYSSINFGWSKVSQCAWHGGCQALYKNEKLAMVKLWIRFWVNLLYCYKPRVFNNASSLIHNPAAFCQSNWIVNWTQTNLGARPVKKQHRVLYDLHHCSLYISDRGPTRHTHHGILWKWW